MSGVGLIGLAVFAVGVLGSIALHEVGHLVPAKRFGVRVTQYMVGFGPTMWSRMRGETEYGVKAIPFGGYIRMVGMFPPHRNREGELVLAASSTGPFQSMVEDARRTSVEEIRAGEEHRAFYQLSVPKKLVVMLGGPTMNLFLAALLYTVALVVLGVPTLTTTVDTVAPCVPSNVEADCAGSDPQSPAAAAGVESGDVVVAVDGVAYDDWLDLVEVVRAQAGEDVVLTVERDGKTLDLPLTVGSTEVPDPDDPTQMVTAGFIGLSPTVEQQQSSITAVPERMWEFVSRSAQAIVSIPSKMVGVWQAAFGDEERDPTGPVSVVGVGRFSVEVARGPGHRQLEGGQLAHPARGAQHGPLLLQPHPAAAAGRRPRGRCPLRGRPPPDRQGQGPPRPRPGRRRQDAAGGLHRRVPAHRDVGPADLRRHREPDHA